MPTCITQGDLVSFCWDFTLSIPVFETRVGTCQQRVSLLYQSFDKLKCLNELLEALCCISVDIDAVAGWLGSYGGEDSTSDISRGLFAGTVGVRRLLKLFAKYDIKTTWYIPGHSLETFPEECAMIRDAGHEIGLHGYSHENPAAMSIEQQHAILDKTYKMLTEFCGKPPRGSVAPWWEASKEGAELMLKYGIEYGRTND